jgi:antibiotic biosynthesis monooxygenase (ABM) superfamily enzyme
MRHVLAPLFHVLPMPAAFLILLTCDIAILTYGVMPRYTRAMNFWLRPAADFTWRQEAGGLAVITGILAVTLGAFLAIDSP